MTPIDVPRSPRAPFHPGLISSGATLLIGAFVTDFLYWRSLLFQWNNFSGWLLAAGLVLAALAAVALVVDLLLRRIGRFAWLRFAGLVVATGLSVVNALVHTRDAYTAVVPQGIILSAIVAVLLLVIGIGGGWSLESRRVVDLHSGPRVRS